MVINEPTYQPKIIEIKGRDGKQQPYLGAHEAITWFRADFPAPRSAIIPTVNTETKIVRAEIFIDGVLVSSADVMNTEGSGKSLEKLETAAIRRALAFLGYGTVGALAAESDGNSENEAGDQAKVAQARNKLNSKKATQNLGSGTKNQRSMRDEQPAEPETEEDDGDDPALSWNDSQVLDHLLVIVQQDLQVDNLTMNEMARLASIAGDPKVLMRWSQKYQTPDVARAAIKDQFDFELLA